MHLSHIRNIFSGLNMFLLGFWHIGCEVVKILVILCMCALPLGFFSVVILDQNGRILCLYCSLKLFPIKSSRWLHSDLCLVNTWRSRFDTWHYFGGKKRESISDFSLLAAWTGSSKPANTGSKLIKWPFYCRIKLRPDDIKWISSMRKFFNGWWTVQ